MKTRYRFDRFVVSPSRRAVFCDGREVPLIPRYFDLLTLLVERRGEAIERREILDEVWRDVVVSDGALSQAVRSLRRVLGDDPRQPTFIRTVPRYGYRFVYADVVEESDAEALPLCPDGKGPDGKAADGKAADGKAADGSDDEAAWEADVGRLLAAPAGPDDRRRHDAAERLHARGTAEALRRIGRRPGHELARAVLRETRWEVAEAGDVPLLGHPGAVRTSAILIRLRLRRVMRLAGSRWATASIGATVAGCIAGLCGAAVLRFGPGSTATDVVFAALPLVGAAVAALGAAGVAAGICCAEVLLRSHRRVGSVLFGAIGGGTVGAASHLVAEWVFQGLFGGNLAPVAGGLEGLVIGAATGAGYALATPTAQGGMAAPKGVGRWRAVVATGVVTALATGALGWFGSHLGAMSLDLMAQAFPDSQVGLGPLARLLGEDEPGTVTRVAISSWEGLLFGAGLAFGLTRRPG